MQLLTIFSLLILHHFQIKLLNWRDRPLLNVSETNLLLNKLQELSIAKLRPDFSATDLSPQALSAVRLALATNLARAALEEPWTGSNNRDIHYLVSWRYDVILSIHAMLLARCFRPHNLLTWDDTKIFLQLILQGCTSKVHITIIILSM